MNPKHKRFLPLGGAFLLSLPLAACGNSVPADANNGDTDSDPDPTPMTYAIGGTVSGTVNGSVTLQNNGTDSVEVGDGSFEFPTQLEDGSDYAVTVAQHPERQLCSVSNANGTVSGANVDNIEVVCRSWRTATSIENGDSGDGAYNPQIAVDGQGNAIAVWEQDDDSNAANNQLNIWANTYTAGSGWGTAEPIESDSSGDARKPQIAFARDGHAIAVWHQDQGDDTDLDVRANTYTTGSGWDEAKTIDNQDGGDAEDPQIAADGQGNAIAVWEQDDGTNYDIAATTYTAADGWGTPKTVDNSTSGELVFSPEVAVYSGGNAIAAWEQEDDANYSIYAKTYSADSGTWESSATLLENGDAGDADNPQIAVDGAGNALAVWYQDDGTNDSIYANRYSADSGTWDSSAALLENGDAGDADDPQISVDGAGNALAVWHQDDGTNDSIYANRYSADSGTWDSSAALLENGDAGDADDPQISVDGAGNAIVVWEQDDGTTDNVRAISYTASNGWSTAATLESSDDGASDVQVAVSSAGNAVAVWEQYNGMHPDLYANRFE